MKVIYIAGPYRAPTEWQVLCNIRNAEAYARQVMALGAGAFCPHKNGAHLGGAVPDEMWLAFGLEMVKRCDAVYCVPGWGESEGALAEIDAAKSFAKPVFYHVAELLDWLDAAKAK